VSPVVRSLTTEEDRERFHAARRIGGLCAACGRALAPDEPVYVERFATGMSYVHGPVGVECASSELLERTRGWEPERCVGCGRAMYYRAVGPRRVRAICSRRCVSRVQNQLRRARI
jgi:hypothetical protein